MQAYTYKKDDFARVFADLAQKYIVIGPKRCAGRGRFSDTDLIKYAPISSLAELELVQKSSVSPKGVVFPADETLFYFNGDTFTEPALADERDVIVLLRPCDINGIERLDKIFLENGTHPDPYYQRRRTRLKFFMIECRESFENCFCVSMSANKSENYAVAIRFADDEVKLQVKDTRFNACFAESGTQSDFSPEFVMENAIKVELPKIDDMPAELFGHKMWEEYDARCIACGRCNTSCVTCSCFSSYDVFYSESRDCGERRRVYDGCHLDGFTDMAGGHSFRKNKGERMRFKTFHKIYDFRKRFGVDMCIGCGRCDDVCPEYISFSTCINKLTKTLKEVPGDDK